MLFTFINTKCLYILYIFGFVENSTACFASLSINSVFFLSFGSFRLESIVK